MFWISGGETQRDGLAAVARETDVRTAVSCLCCNSVTENTHHVLVPSHRCQCVGLVQSFIHEYNVKMTQRNHFCILIPKLG